MQHPELSELTLTEEQITRLIEAATDDSKHWVKEAQDGVLPDVSTMHLDWWIDHDLIESGVTDEIMQRISFRIAESNKTMKITNDEELEAALAWLVDNTESTPERSEAIVQYWTKPGQFIAENTPLVEDIFNEWGAQIPSEVDVNDYAEEFWKWVGFYSGHEPKHFCWEGNGDVYWLCQVGKGESVREALEAWAAEIADTQTTA
jgi:hypothetical protein